MNTLIFLFFQNLVPPLDSTISKSAHEPTNTLPIIFLPEVGPTGFSLLPKLICTHDFTRSSLKLFYVLIEDHWEHVRYRFEKEANLQGTGIQVALCSTLYRERDRASFRHDAVPASALLPLPRLCSDAPHLSGVTLSSKGYSLSG